MSIELTKSKTVTELKSLLYVIFIAMLIRTFVIELFFVPTGSMKATVLEGDYIFSTKYSYGFSNHSIPFSPNLIKDRIFSSRPSRGDIVIFRPPMNMDIRYIKRLIGLPGDKIQLINDVIYINNIAVKREMIGDYIDEKGKKYKKFKETLPGNITYNTYLSNYEEDFIKISRYNNTEVFYVPQDHFFFLGDNRNESNDSRVDLGFVPFKNFIAKAQLILFSTKELFWLENISIIKRISRIWVWVSSVRYNRILNIL